MTYDETIKLAALAVLSGNLGQAKTWSFAAIRLRDGFVSARKIKKAVVRSVIADVLEHMTNAYAAALVLRLADSPEAAEEAEAALGHALRSGLARLAERLPVEH